MSNFTDLEEEDFQDGFATGEASKSWKGSCCGGGSRSWTYHRWGAQSEKLNSSWLNLKRIALILFCLILFKQWRVRMTPPPYVDDRRDGGGACRTCINITKWMPVLFICTVISWSYYAFVIQLCLFAMRQVWAQILALMVYHVSLILFLWSYWQTIFTNSSRVPRKFRIPPSKWSVLYYEILRLYILKMLRTSSNFITFSQTLWNGWRTGEVRLKSQKSWKNL